MTVPGGPAVGTALAAARCPEAAPQVSVVLAVRNGAPYVADAVRSVLGQTLRSLELIVVDDGSVDGTREILRELVHLGVHVIALDRPHGVAFARNRGLAEAVGPYIAWLDADDTWYPHKLLCQVAVLDACPEVVCTGGPMEIPGLRGEIVGRAGLMGRTASQAQLRAGRCMPFPLSSCIVRTSEVRVIGGFDESLDAERGRIEDHDLITRLAARGEVRWLPVTVGTYRVHTSSATGGAMRAQQQASAQWRRSLSGHDGATGPWRDVPRLHNAQYAMRKAMEARVSGGRFRAAALVLAAFVLAPGYARRKLKEFVW